MNAGRLPPLLYTIAGLKSSSGGTSSAVTAACSGLARAGVAVDLVSQEFGDPGDRNILPEAGAVRVSLAQASRLPLLGTVYSPGLRALVKRTCRDAGTGLVHDHGLWLPANHAVAAVCRDLRLPLVASPHGMLSPDALAHDKGKKRVAWWAFQRRDLSSAAAVCVTSGQEADDVRAAGCGRPIAVIPHGVDMPAMPTGSAARDGPRIALYLGRIHPIKGLLALVEAWATVRPQGWRVVVAGPDEEGYRKVVEEAVARAGLGDAFAFPGAVFGAAKTALYESASLFVSPSLSENFGVTIAEALAHRLPVIATKGAPWGSIAQEGCGWWVDPGARALAAAIREATALPDAELRAMGGRGRLYVERSFDWARVVAMLIALYGWVLGNEAQPDFVAGK